MEFIDWKSWVIKEKQGSIAGIGNAHVGSFSDWYYINGIIHIINSNTTISQLFLEVIQIDVFPKLCVFKKGGM